MNDLISELAHYAGLGYDVSLTTIFGKEGLRMVKAYDHKLETHIVSEQIFDYTDLTTNDRFKKVLAFMYEEIQTQAKEGRLRESSADYILNPEKGIVYP